LRPPQLAFSVSRSVRPARQQPELPETRAQHDGAASVGAAELRRRRGSGQGAGGAARARNTKRRRAYRPGLSADARADAIAGRASAGARVLAAIAAVRVVPGAV